MYNSVVTVNMRWSILKYKILSGEFNRVFKCNIETLYTLIIYNKGVRTQHEINRVFISQHKTVTHHRRLSCKSLYHYKLQL